MKRKKYTEQQIIKILKEAEAGVPVAELSRQYGVSQSSFLNGKPNMAVWMFPRSKG